MTSTEIVGVQMAQHFLLSRCGTFAKPSESRPHVRRGSPRRFPANPLGRHQRRAGLPALRLRCQPTATRRASSGSAKLARTNSASRQVRSSPAASCRCVTILLAIAIFVNGAKGHSALQLSRDLDCQYKTAFVLAHKLREALAARNERTQPCPAKSRSTAPISAATCSRPTARENRGDRRLAEHQTGKRRVVVIMRERNGITLAFRVQLRRRSQSATIAKRVDGGATVHADEASALGYSACALSDEAHQSLRKLFGRRSLHEPGRELLFPPAPRRNRHASPHQRARTLAPTPQKWRGARTTAASAMANSTLWRRMRR